MFLFFLVITTNETRFESYRNTRTKIENETWTLMLEMDGKIKETAEKVLRLVKIVSDLKRDFECSLEAAAVALPTDACHIPTPIELRDYIQHTSFICVLL